MTNYTYTFIHFNVRYLLINMIATNNFSDFDKENINSENVQATTCTPHLKKKIGKKSVLIRYKNGKTV